MQECGNCCGIKVMSYTMTLLEGIIDSQIRQKCTLLGCQYGFHRGDETMNHVLALRIVTEKNRTKNTLLHCLNMQNVFDCVHRDLLCEAHITPLDQARSNEGGREKTRASTTFNIKKTKLTND